jgi:hypothetical protein
VRSSNPQAQGYSTPAAKSLGVNAVPFELLVARDGRVVAIQTLGEKGLAMILELLQTK